jgi:hypothetical protein
VAEGYARRGPFPPSESFIALRATFGTVLLVGALDSWFLPAETGVPDDARIVDVMATLVARGFTT